MIIKYEFETKLLDEDLERGEEYWATQEYEFEIDVDDEKKVATQILMEEQGFDKETAKKIVENVIWNYDLLDNFLESNRDFVECYFEDKAQKEFWQSRED